MMKKNYGIFLCLMIGLLIPFGVAAQNPDEQLVLGLTRTFGYGGLDGKIQGAFKLKIRSEHADLIQVDFLLDGEIMQSVNAPPFEYAFNTAGYSEGQHTFGAVGYRRYGTEMHADEFSRNFLSSENAWGEVRTLVGPLIAVIGVLTLAGTLGPLLFTRKKKFVLGHYGMAGGAVCPRCAFPYARSIFAPNLLTGKLQVCPHCGKWAVVPAASADDLQAAEARLSSEGTASVEPPSEEEQLKKLLDDSRYER